MYDMTMIRLFVICVCCIVVTPLEYGNFSTIFHSENVASHYENCRLFENVRVFHNSLRPYDWSRSLDGLDPQMVLTVVLSARDSDPWRRAGAAALMAMRDFCRHQHLLAGYTFE